VFRLPDGSESRIDYAVWLDATIRYESLEVGDTRELLLLLQIENKKTGETHLTALHDRRDMNDNFPNPFSWFRSEDFPLPKSVQVTIIEQRTRSKYVFDLDVKGTEKAISIVRRDSAVPLDHTAS